MARDIKYFTQLTAEDLRKMLAAGNIKAGFGLEIKADGDSLVIGISKTELIKALWAYVEGGWIGSPSGQCRSRWGLKTTLAEANFDPIYNT